MMLQHDLDKNPGKWRPGSIHVRDEARNVNVYDGPSRELVEPLMAELIADLDNKEKDDQTHRAIRAALAHLNLVMIHPFSDGNGRMARCLQTLVFARHGILEPEFCSVEEYCGKQQRAYYDVLAEVGKGSWHPENNTLPWVQFMLRAHFVQASRVLWVNTQLENLWAEAEMLCRARGLHERTIQLVVDAMIGNKIRNSAHRSFANISDNLASRDLKSLVDARLLVPQGRNRGRFYEGSPVIKAVADRTLQRFVPPDPFKPKEVQASLPL